MPTIQECFPIQKPVNEIQLHLMSLFAPKEIAGLVTDYLASPIKPKEQADFFEIFSKNEVPLDTAIDEKFAFEGVMATALIVAAKNSLGSVMRTLIEHGADVNQGVIDLNTAPVIFTVSQGNEELTKLLIMHGAKKPNYDKRRQAAEIVFFDKCKSAVDAEMALEKEVEKSLSLRV